MDIFSTNTNATVNSTSYRNGSEVVPTSEGPKSFYARETEVSHMFRLVFYSLIFVFTLIGNSLVIAIVVRSKELRTVTGYLIANLAVADFSVGAICIPFTIIYYELNHWPFGYAMCKLLPTAQGMSIMASIGTITAISLDRFRSIVHPYEPRITTSQVKYILIVVWLMAASVGFPLLAVMETQYQGEQIVCQEMGWPSDSYRKAYSVITFAMTYAIPLPLVSLWYVIIVVKLRQSAKDTGDNEGFRVAQAKGKVVRMLIAVVACYALCFVPFYVTHLWWEFGNGSSFRYIWVMLSWSQVLLYSNSAVNPILYSFLSIHFRRGLKQVFCCHQNCCSTTTRSGRFLSLTYTYDRYSKTLVCETVV